MNTGSPYPRRGVLVAILLAAMVASAGGARAAQDTPDAQVRLTIASLTGVLGPGGVPPDAPVPDDVSDLRLRVLVENAGGEPVEDLSLLVEVFDRAHFRSELHAALDGGTGPTRLLEGERLDLRDGAAVAPGEVVGVEVAIPADRIGWADGTGVHPLRVSVLRGRPTLADVDTAVVHLDRAPTGTLPTLVGWPIDAAPTGLGDETDHRELTEAIAPGGRLERLASAAAGTPGAQLLLGSHLVEDLARGEARGDTAARAVLERLRAAVAAPSAAPVTGPYADAHLAGLLAAGLELEAARAVSLAPGQLAQAAGRSPLPHTLWATTRLDRASLREVLDPVGVRTVILPWDTLQVADSGAPPARTPAAVQPLRAGATEITAVVGDPWLTDLLAELPDEHGPVVAVQRVVAETAQVHLEAPNASDRGLVLLPPPGWHPHHRVPALLLETMQRLPWVEPVGVSELLARTVSARGEPATTSQREVEPLPDRLVRELESARGRLASLREAITIDAIEGYAWDELERVVLRAPSGWWIPERPGRALDLLEEVQGVLSAGAGEISLPSNQRLTLTDTEVQPIPITVSRPTGPPIRVVVELDSAAKLEFPEGNARLVTLVAGDRQTLSIPAVAQAAGRFPVRVLVKTPGALDPAGSPWVQLNEATIVVQSTAISANALVVLGVVFALLMVWWIVRRVRPSPPQLRVVRDEAA